MPCNAAGSCPWAGNLNCIGSGFSLAQLSHYFNGPARPAFVLNNPITRVSTNFLYRLPFNDFFTL